MSIDCASSWYSEFRKIDDITIFHVDLTPDSDREGKAFALLDSDEQVRWQHFKRRQPRREFALVRTALRAILCARLGCRPTQLKLNIADYGKPFALVGQSRAPVSFNVTHSGNHGLIAVAHGMRVGVDVEPCIYRKDIDDITGLVFTPAEQAEVAEASGQRKFRLFYRIWTLKEALIKALGMGFYMDTTRFEIPSEMRAGATWSHFRFPGMPETTWKIQSIGNRELAAAIAYEVSEPVE